jgi:phosphoglycerate dehydrogenase-like enzyme
MKALILAPFSQSAIERLQLGLDEVIYESWMDTNRLVPTDELVERIQGQGIEIVVVEADFILRDIFERADKLKLVGVCRGTVTHVDIQAATEHSVVVINTPGRNAVAVAELTIGLMLSLARKIPAAHQMVSSGNWVDPILPYRILRGMELAGKTVGIVGFGAIGQQVVERLKSFDTTMLVYDPLVDPLDIKMAGARPTELDELITISDFISLHCPAIPETKGLINAKRIALIKPTAYLVNLTGASVVEGEAIIHALKEGKIAGAAFDVFETMTVSPDDPLLGLGNVILTPHIGGATHETVERHSHMIAGDIERFLKGQRPENMLNPQAWDKIGG